MGKVENMVKIAQQMVLFFPLEYRKGTSNGVHVTRVITDTAFSKRDCAVIKALGAYQAGNAIYKSQPGAKFGWFDVAD